MQLQEMKSHLRETYFMILCCIQYYTCCLELPGRKPERADKH